jgi:hypothetical protein
VLMHVTAQVPWDQKFGPSRRPLPVPPPPPSSAR